MTRPVSIVIPCLDDRDLLKANLPALLEEIEVRAEKDEVVIVDDTGEQVLADWVAAEFPECRVVSQKKNLGFAKALLAGIKSAKHDLVFCMNPDVLVRKGFLGPLVACMADEDVFAVAPRVLLDGKHGIESITELKVAEGFVEIVQLGLEANQEHQSALPRPIVFAVGGTCLISKSTFLEMGGMDPMYEPFYLEDLDVCFRAWLNGQRVLYQPASVVEHHHRGTIGKIVEPEFVRAMIEKNRLLFQWVFLDEKEDIQEHIGAVYRRATDAWLSDSREELIWILLALDQLKTVMKSRKSNGKRSVRFADVLKASSES